MQRCKSELLDFLQSDFGETHAVVMPDFFMDRIINLDCEPQQFSSAVNDVVKRKGGSIDQILQTDVRGGNALNVASALLALGATVTPIVCTNRLGLVQIRFHLRNHDVDTSHVKILPKASLTTALELKTKDGKANVMLRDLGSLVRFGPADLAEKDYDLIEKADYICLFNWAGTKEYGTQLARTVFKFAKKGKCRTYLDTADPTPNKEKIPELMEKVLKTREVDILSLNENEAVTYASCLNGDVSKKRGKIEFNELALLSAQILAKNLHARIDLHTTTFSATVTREQAVFVPAFKVEALRATGAGDAWDAGNLIGDSNKLSDECRLTLANAVSACYLSDPEGEHPTKQKLVKFLRSAKMPSH